MPILKRSSAPAFSLDQRRRIARRSLQVFGRNFLELFWTSRLTSENIDKIISFEDPERLRELVESEVPFIAITPHFGNVELAGTFIGLKGRPLVIISQPFKNELLTPIFRKLREATGHKIIVPDNAVVRLLKALRSGESIFLFTDLTLKLRDSAVIIDGFGLKMRVTQIHAFLHQRTGFPDCPVGDFAAGRWRLHGPYFALAPIPGQQFLPGDYPGLLEPV